VEYLHAMRVVHRDLKLENLLVDLSLDAPRLKICDFGYSKSVGDGPQDSQPKTRIGTAAYISPEVYHGVQPYDGKASDVWACGVVLYVMLVGKYPFQDPEHPGSNHATMWRVLDVAYDPPPNASPECLDLLAEVFVKEPKQRLTVQGITAHEWFARDLSPEVPLGPTQPTTRREPPPGAQTVDAIEAILAEAATAERPTSGGAEGSLGGGAMGKGGCGGIDEEGARRGFGMEF
jgi:serine/threonine-protein kinase SRK2